MPPESAAGSGGAPARMPSSIEGGLRATVSAAADERRRSDVRVDQDRDISESRMTSLTRLFHLPRKKTSPFFGNVFLHTEKLCISKVVPPEIFSRQVFKT